MVAKATDEGSRVNNLGLHCAVERTPILYSLAAMNEEKIKKPSEEKALVSEEDLEDFPEDGLRGEDLEWLECRICPKEDQETSSLESLDEESDVDLHCKFVNLSLENDLKGEELEWFKSRIRRVEDEVKTEKKTISGPITVQILTQADLEKPDEKSNKILLRLTETKTIWFFSLDTKYTFKDSDDAEKVRRENETYQKKKTKIEIIRKRCMADAQTPRFIEKSAETVTTPIRKADAAVFASEWDLYDTYGALDKYEEAPSGKYLQMTGSAELSTNNNLNPVDCLTAEDSASKLFRSSDFEYASLVTERLLAANRFHQEQLVFKTKYRTRYDTEPTTFSYDIEQLWDFQKDFDHPLFVTDMDWNPLNKDLIAVSYGELEYQGKPSGLICVWSPKNPHQPERQWQFDDSITSLHYSRLEPNILAFGTRKGDVFVTDVSVTKDSLRTLTSSKPHPGPVWKVEWILHKALTLESEKLLTVGESGILTLFSPTEKTATDMLKLDYVTSTQNSAEKLPSKKLHDRPQIQHEVFDKKTFSGLCFSTFSNNNFCYIATKEGALVKCNLRNPSMTDGIFLAHEGPVYVIEHSPVTDLVYLTCGADWTVKIWMEEITQPLVTLQHKNPVACARWSPTIPTIVATVTDSTLTIWDIARNILSPMTVKTFEDVQKPLSTLLFSTNGANIVLGSQNGLVRVVHLSELPRMPFLQKEALIGAIKRALLKKETELIKEFSRAIRVNKEKLQTKVIP